MLALLAALIPIVGSLYAGASFLLEHRSLAIERRTREHVEALAALRQPAAAARAQRAKAWDKQWYQREGEELQDFRRVMLAAHGIDGLGPTWAEHGIDLAMSGPKFSRLELRRQRVVLLTASIGVALLAASLQHGI